MSEKITMQDIIELLAEKHSMTKKDAEAFVKGMFELIEEALAAEKYVKVKGLGTFKLTEVGSRESVNVNTGERIEIQGHTKISFTPDAGMKDLINKPFAHFETVILNENTKLDDTETEIEGEEEEALEEVAADIREEVAVVEEMEPAETEKAGDFRHGGNAIAEDTVPAVGETMMEEEPETVDEIAEEEPEAEAAETEEKPREEEPAAETEEEPQTVEAEEVPEETVTEAEEDIVAETATAASQTENAVAMETTPEENRTGSAPRQEEEVMTIADAAMLATREGKTLSEAMAKEEFRPSNPPTADFVIPDSEEEKKKAEERNMQEEATGGKKAKAPWGIIIAIIVLILCIAGGIYWCLQADKTLDPQSPTTINTSRMQSAEAVPTAPAHDSLMQEKDTANSPASAPMKETMSQEEATSTEETTSQPQRTATAATAKVPAGAAAGNKTVAKETLADTVEYDITGTKAHYTLQEGESLVKLAVKFYGTKKLWPYIVKHNKDVIKDADRVPIGTTLRIPELSPKK